jgi:S1-C subfamily serine protease
MTYETAQQLGVNVTYGWLVSTVVSGGPSDGKLQANDVIIALNGTRTKNGDDLASYLEENTMPEQNLTITVVRGTITENVTVTLGRRPSPSA